jgi:hypothetical protein
MGRSVSKDRRANQRRLAIFSCASDLHGQTKEEVRKAFRDLRNDRIRYNCSRATYWLYKHREALRDQTLEELTTKFLKENEEEPPEPEWIKEYTEKYFVVKRYP